MSTLVDYVRWMGDLDFTARPLDETDAVVLALLSYCDLKPLFQERSEIYVRDIRRLIEHNRLRILVAGKDTGAADVLRAAVRTRRFGDLRITDYVDIFEEDQPLQFAAMTVRESTLFSVVLYRGTDDSLAGWKEDFMISFTKADYQELARSYAERVIEYDRDCYIIGHSKGGNSALYAAAFLSDDKLASVKHIYLLDSPGFCPEVLDTSLLDRFRNRTTRILPEFAVVGKIFEPDIPDLVIVKSDQATFLQHAPNSWLVKDGKLDKTDRFSETSEWLNRVLGEWIRELPMEERPKLGEELFAALEKSGAKDVSDLNIERIVDALYNLSNVSENTKKNLSAFPKMALFGPAAVQKKPADTAASAPKNKVGWFQALVKSPLFLAIVLILLGIGMLFLSGNLIDVLAIVLISGVTLLQLGLTIKKIIENKGKTDGLRDRIVISIGMIAFVAILFIKENATFFFGSLVFGVGLLALAYITGDRAVKEKENKFLRILSIVECVLLIGLGVSALLIPRSAAHLHSILTGSACIADGIARIVELILRKRRPA